MRDVGCSILAIITAIICGVHAAWYAHLLVFGLQWGALSTYCKFGKQPDVYWYNWLCAGLFCGFSSIFYVIFGDVSWLEFGIRMIATGIGFWAWSVLIGWDVAEEAGRGFIFNISIRLLTLIK
jgi:hypothetical protein